MRTVVVAALAALAGTARAEPEAGARVEASAFFGVSSPSDDVALGGAAQPDQRPQTAPMFGARVGYVIAPWSPIQLAAEAELSATKS